MLSIGPVDHRANTFHLEPGETGGEELVALSYSGYHAFALASFVVLAYPGVTYSRGRRDGVPGLWGLL